MQLYYCRHFTEAVLHSFECFIYFFCLQFMILLILRHTLPVIVSRDGNYSLPLFMVMRLPMVRDQSGDNIEIPCRKTCILTFLLLLQLLMLRIMGIILPICIILKAVTSIIRRRQQQVNELPISIPEISKKREIFYIYM